MGGGLDQGAVGVLAVDFDQRRADLAEKRRGDRLIVDEGAAAPIRPLHAAQDQVAVGIEAGGAQRRRGRDDRRRRRRRR